MIKKIFTRACACERGGGRRLKLSFKESLKLKISLCVRPPSCHILVVVFIDDDDPNNFKMIKATVGVVQVEKLPFSHMSNYSLPNKLDATNSNATLILQ